MQLRNLVEQLSAKGITLELVGSGAVQVLQVASLASATSQHISFLNDPKYVPALKSTQAGAVILTAQNAKKCSVPHLIVHNPYYVYALVAQILNPNIAVSGIHKSASIHIDTEIEPKVAIDANVVLYEGVKVSNQTHIKAGTVIEAHVQIGQNCIIGSNVVIGHHCIIGNNVIIEAGAVIGGDGFGWANNQGEWVKIPQIGRVVIGNHVSIGNNSCIDRGAIDDTVIEDGCIIDNLVHIAHNVKIGKGSAIAGQVGFAGSTTLGAHCTVGGQAGFTGHMTITEHTHFFARACTIKSIDKSGVYSGFPSEPVSDWKKNNIRARNLDKMAKQIKSLQAKIDELSS